MLRSVQFFRSLCSQIPSSSLAYCKSPATTTTISSRKYAAELDAAKMRPGDDPDNPGKGDPRNSDLPRKFRHSTHAVEELTDGDFNPAGIPDEDRSQRTTVSFLSDTVHEDQVYVHAFSNYGFRINNHQTLLYGPVILFPKLALSWKVLSVDNIDAESLSFFDMLEPRIDVLVLGVGEQENIEAVRLRVAPFLKQRRIPFEVMSTEHACATYNYLSSEKRYVAAALFPPLDVGHVSVNERLSLSMEHRDPFKTTWLGRKPSTKERRAAGLELAGEWKRLANEVKEARAEKLALPEEYKEPLPTLEKPALPPALKKD